MKDILGYVIAVVWFGIGFWGWWLLYKKAAVTRYIRWFLILLFIFAIPFGLITFIIGLIIPKYKECPYCKNAIVENSLVCMYCHRDQ